MNTPQGGFGSFFGSAPARVAALNAHAESPPLDFFRIPFQSRSTLDEKSNLGLFVSDRRRRERQTHQHPLTQSAHSRDFRHGLRVGE
jgi:hypothetical protein